MVRDYAKRSTTRRQPPKNRGKAILITVFVFSVISILAALFFAQQVQLFHHKKKEPTAASQKKLTSIQSKVLAVPDAQESNQDYFDFYTVLTKTEAPAPQNVAEATVRGERYLLQIAALQNAGEAGRLKNHIADLGFVSFVESFQAPSGIVLNRVCVGPYNSLASAERVQLLLHHHDINSILVRIK